MIGSSECRRLRDPGLGQPPLVELANVTVLRDGHPALRDLSLTIEQGESVAILGPNGSGKSSFMKLLTRELYPAAGSGTMRIMGSERWHVAELRRTLGIVSSDWESAMDPDATAEQVVSAGLEGYFGGDWSASCSAALAALDAAGAGRLCGRKFRTLSSGEARRVMIARALVNEPGSLLFDEPTTSLDLAARTGLVDTMSQLARRGTSLVLITHHVEEIVPEITRVILLREGQVVADGARQEIMTSENITRLFGMAVELIGRGPYRAVMQ